MLSGKDTGERIISIHVPTRGTTELTRWHQICFAKFQSTSPRGGRQIDSTSDRVWSNFNPRPHEGDDGFDGVLQYNYGVFQSTSPRGGRRNSKSFLQPFFLYFNPRPHEGDDVFPLDVPKSNIYFNPRPHEGDDLSFLTYASSKKDFNPRPHEGDDGYITSFLTTIPKFQSTSPRGGRRFLSNV